MGVDELQETNTDPGLDAGTDTPVDTGTEPVSTEKDNTEQQQPKKNESVRDTITRSMKELRPEEQKAKKTPDKPGAAVPGQQAGSKGSTTPGARTPQTADKPSGPPQSWKSEEKVLWDGLPEPIKAAVHRREADTQRGIEQLRNQYQELDGAVAPYRDNIKRFGLTEAKAVDQLFKWQMALAGPDKVKAFRALMQSHGVDPATVAGTAPTSPSGDVASPQNVIPPHVQQALDGINAKLGQYDQHFVRQMQSAAEQTVMTWAKDKPHYEKVRVLMVQLIQSGAVPLNNGIVDLDAAYTMATHAHPEVRDLIAQEDRSKADAARKAANDKARKAGLSMRTGAPVPPADNAGKLNGAQRNETVRDSIKRALAELRQ